MKALGIQLTVAVVSSCQACLAAFREGIDSAPPPPDKRCLASILCPVFSPRPKPH